jgi:hypothetical protein
MGFWVKRILIIIFIMVAAGLVIIFMPEPELDENGNPIEKRSIATNMAKFYEEFAAVSDTRINEKFGERVILLDLPDTPLGKQITSIRRVPRDSDNDEPFNWRGSYQTRAFGEGSTLKEIATEYVKTEGMDLIWHLNQDFIVSSRFFSENTVSGMMNELAGAIDVNFPGQVKVYFCEEQLVMVITDQDAPVLSSSCMLVRKRR